ncbi:hypothetical protein SDC9_162522 [bioreactor metagenome]|uniref:Uncharacterized protein n=1 Tax=bioreactor metagenome TaxID=1076179 RepID=A0A645FSX7_9ZZZZ
MFLEHGTIDEVFTLYKLGNPTQSRFNRRSRIINVIAVQTEAHLQTKRIAGTQSHGLDSKLLPRFKNSIPYSICMLGIEIEFKTTGTRIAGI